MECLTTQKANKMKRINIDEINFDLEYEGYIWYSNQRNPKMITKFNKSDFTDLPFIIEGNLYAANKKISISIKNIDGAYFITQTSLDNLPKDQITEQEFLSHKLDGIKKIKMVQFWEEVEDELCEGMKTLKPSWQAFQGFIKN